MPILKIPVIHKFGIISHVQRLDLQDRLYEESQRQNKSKKSFSSRPSPFDINEGFIDKFNEVFSEGNTKKLVELEDILSKTLLKNQRRLGIRNSCRGCEHINLPLAWSELALILQCKSNKFSECVDLLLMSLHLAPLNVDQQLATLYFLGETVLYLLQTRNIGDSNDAKSDHLIRDEDKIKLIKIGELIFIRIYICDLLTEPIESESSFHATEAREEGSNNDKMQAKQRIRIYLQDFHNFRSAFSNWRTALISFHVVLEVGHFLANQQRAAPKPLFSSAIRILLSFNPCWPTTRQSDRDKHEALANWTSCLLEQHKQTKHTESVDCIGKWIDCHIAGFLLAEAAKYDVNVLVVLKSTLATFVDLFNTSMSEQSADGVNRDTFLEAFMPTWPNIRQQPEEHDQREVYPEITRDNNEGKSATIDTDSLSSCSFLLLAIAYQQRLLELLLTTRNCTIRENCFTSPHGLFDWIDQLSERTAHSGDAGRDAGGATKFQSKSTTQLHYEAAGILETLHQICQLAVKSSNNKSNNAINLKRRTTYQDFLVFQNSIWFKLEGLLKNQLSVKRNITPCLYAGRVWGLFYTKLIENVCSAALPTSESVSTSVQTSSGSLQLFHTQLAEFFLNELASPQISVENNTAISSKSTHEVQKPARTTTRNKLESDKDAQQNAKNIARTLPLRKELELRQIVQKISPHNQHQRASNNTRSASTGNATTGYYHRTDLALFRVVEDQWRKSLHEELEAATTPNNHQNHVEHKEEKS